MSRSPLAALQARQLRATLSPSIDPIAAARDALRIFTDAADDVRVRWLNLELQGYRDAMDAIGPLHEVLGVPPHDRLAVHVAAYRTQRGTRPSQDVLSHFFVEPLSELVAAQERARSLSGTSLDASFGPDPTSNEYPTTASFPRDLFDRIIGGFLAALHLQLGDVV